MAQTYLSWGQYPTYKLLLKSTIFYEMNNLNQPFSITNRRNLQSNIPPQYFIVIAFVLKLYMYSCHNHIIMATIVFRFYLRHPNLSIENVNDLTS